MTADEYHLWKRFYADEPFGPIFDYHRAGAIAAAVINSQRTKKMRALTPADFFPLLRQKKTAGGIAGMKAILDRMAHAGK